MELENINVDCYFDFYDNGYDYPPQHPTTNFLKFIGIIFYVFGYLNECEFEIFIVIYVIDMMMNHGNLQNTCLLKIQVE